MVHFPANPEVDLLAYPVSLGWNCPALGQAIQALPVILPPFQNLKGVFGCGRIGRRGILRRREVVDDSCWRMDLLEEPLIFGRRVVLTLGFIKLLAHGKLARPRDSQGP